MRCVACSTPTGVATSPSATAGIVSPSSFGATPTLCSPANAASTHASSPAAGGSESGLTHALAHAPAASGVTAVSVAILTTGVGGVPMATLPPPVLPPAPVEIEDQQAAEELRMCRKTTARLWRQVKRRGLTRSPCDLLADSPTPKP